jgi:FkbM family methyltransferase
MIDAFVTYYLAKAKNNLSLKFKEKNEDVFNEVIRDNCYLLSLDQVLGKVVYDIGANRGMFSAFCAELGARKVLAFEPVVSTFSMLKENVGDYLNVLTFHNAVSDVSDQEVKIFMKEGCDDGRNNLYEETDLFDIVKTVTLDDMVKQHPPDGGILKLDCEGAEYEILLHSSNETLSQINTVCLELHADRNPKYQGFALVEDRLLDLGFNMIQCNQMMYWAYPGAEPTPLAARIEKWVK